MDFRIFFRALVLSLTDGIIPPRRSTTVVDALTSAEVGALRMPLAAGDIHRLLPYRDHRVRALVWELKYHQSERAAALVAPLLAEEVEGVASETVGTPLMIPAPMHPKRRRERGYNQTEFLCEHTVSALSARIHYVPHVLVRTRHTPPQQGLPRGLRQHNLRGAMQVPNAAEVRGRMCIVIDDVATTGATLAEARRALRAAGAAEIYCLALAG